MTSTSNALNLELATRTARLAKDSGQDVTGEAASALVDVVGQVNDPHRRFYTFQYASDLRLCIHQIRVDRVAQAELVLSQTKTSLIKRRDRDNMGYGAINSDGGHEIRQCLEKQRTSFLPNLGSCRA